MALKINNLPKYAEDKKFIVVREIEDELWFYGAFDQPNQANECALEIGGIVLMMKRA